MQNGQPRIHLCINLLVVDMDTNTTYICIHNNLKQICIRHDGNEYGYKQNHIYDSDKNTMDTVSNDSNPN